MGVHIRRKNTLPLGWRRKAAQPHRRDELYPWHRAYYALGPVDRPLVGAIQRPLYRSDVVSTDIWGFRCQYGPAGEQLHLDDLRRNYDRCRVLLGGSTAFGVGAVDDRSTIGARLQESDCPCLNLAIRAGTSSNELMAFLAVAHLLPRVEDVILLTGVNECVVAGQFVVPVDRLFGGMFLGNAATASMASPDRFSAALADDRLDALLDRVRANYRIWAALSQEWGFDIHIVLQPVMHWGKRRYTDDELACFADDAERIPSLGWLARPEIHDRVWATLQRLLVDASVWDANEWFDHHQTTLFCDVCHLTDVGNRIVATEIAKRACSADS